MPRRPVNPPEPPPVEWCDGCERFVIEGANYHHDEDCSLYREPPEPYCSICNPRPDEHRHHGPTGRGPVFCERHDEDDWQVYLEHAEKVRRGAIRDEMARRYAEDRDFPMEWSDR